MDHCAARCRLPTGCGWLAQSWPDQWPIMVESVHTTATSYGVRATSAGKGGLKALSHVHSRVSEGDTGIRNGPPGRVARHIAGRRHDRREVLFQADQSDMVGTPPAPTAPLDNQQGYDGQQRKRKPGASHVLSFWLREPTMELGTKMPAARQVDNPKPKHKARAPREIAASPPRGKVVGFFSEKHLQHKYIIQDSWRKSIGRPLTFQSPGTVIHG